MGNSGYERAVTEGYVLIGSPPRLTESSESKELRCRSTQAEVSIHSDDCNLKVYYVASCNFTV